jgi:CheY-like chemotaxis protein
MATSRVLFIEDNPRWREFLKEILETAGHETRHAATLEGAIHLLNSKEKIDVIVFDLNLGSTKENRNPYVWLDALKDGLIARDISIPPIIVVTGMLVSARQVGECFAEYRGIVYDFFEKSGFEESERRFLQSVRDAAVTHSQKPKPASLLRLLGYSLLIATIFVLIIGVLFWSVSKITDPKTQQIFLQVGGALIVVFVVFVFMLAQSTKIENVIDSITKIWRN